MSTEQKPPTEDESLKRGSDFLRGTIVAGLRDGATGAVTGDDAKLLKFHGTYLQDDRDLRIERMQQKLEPHYQFMVRVRMPGGVCTPAQWLAMDALARSYGGGSLRITTRQTFQFHGIAKHNLRATIASINAALLSTIAACGDVNRNVVCHNNPYLSPTHRDVYQLACALSEHLKPGTRAYQQIWIDGKAIASDTNEEPLYGATYLPRKFKIGITIPPYNDIDVLAQDLGFIAIVEAGSIVGYDVCVGGGMGMSHGDAATYPRIGDVIGFCTPQQVIGLAEAILAIQRDFGDRTNRKHARFKYTIDDRGIDWLHDEIEKRLGQRLADARHFEFVHNRDPEGWLTDPDGHHHLLLNVLSGRIRDARLDAMREIAALGEGEFRLTTNQNVMVSAVSAATRERIDSILLSYGINANEQKRPVFRDAISCVAFPTCGLAMAESERMLPAFLRQLQQQLDEFDLAHDSITVRVSGCPNGCSRPYLSEIALVGRSLGRYDLYLGANPRGTRMNRLYRTNITEDDVLASLRPLFERYARERSVDESFGDFVVRANYVVPCQDPRDYNRN